MNYKGSGSDFDLERVDQNGNLHRNLLDSSNCYLLDCITELFVWTGKTASLPEKENALAFAQSYVKTHNRPDWTRITRAQDSTFNIQIELFLNC
jgi:hypothetical protein